MATTQPAALPPTTIHSIRHSIPQSAAHEFLSAYLERATTDPALQPNAIISEHGPVSRTSTAAPNLILHNLKRIQAGLAGEVLGRDLTFPTRTVSNNMNQGQEKDIDGALMEWEDPEKWGRGQADPMNEGDNSDETMLHAQLKNDADGKLSMGITGESSGTVHKEERKRKKKERRLLEKRAKAQRAETKEDDTD